LNRANVGAGFEQMNGKGVPQGIRSDGFRQARAMLCLSAGTLDGVSGDRLTEISGEEPPFLPHDPPVVT
jgi:hypothetical protein